MVGRKHISLIYGCGSIAYKVMHYWPSYSQTVPEPLLHPSSWALNLIWAIFINRLDSWSDEWLINFSSFQRTLRRALQRHLVSRHFSILIQISVSGGPRHGSQINSLYTLIQRQQQMAVYDLRVCTEFFSISLMNLSEWNRRWYTRLIAFV